MSQYLSFIVLGAIILAIAFFLYFVTRNCQSQQLSTGGQITYSNENVYEETFKAICENDADSLKEILGRSNSKKLTNTKLPQYSPLMVASMLGRLEIAKLLISKKADVNFKRDGYNALMLAIKNNHEGVAKELIDSRADVNYTDGLISSPLHLAIECDASLEFVQYLLDKGANSTRSINNSNPMTLAAKLGKDDIVQLLEEYVLGKMNHTEYGRLNESSRDIYDSPNSSQVIDDETRNKLFEFIVKNQGEKLKNIFDKLEPLRHEEYTNSLTPPYYPIIVASMLGFLQTVKTLRSNGANVNEKQSEMTALVVAIQEDHLKTAKFLLSENAYVNVPNSIYRPLNIAVKNKNFEIVQALLGKGALMDQFTQKIAIRKHSNKILKLLLEKGDRSFDWTESYTQSIVNEAIAANNIPIIRTILGQISLSENQKKLLRDKIDENSKAKEKGQNTYNDFVLFDTANPRRGRLFPPKLRSQTERERESMKNAKILYEFLQPRENVQTFGTQTQKY